MSSIAQALAEGQQAGARYALSAPRRSPQGSSGTQLSRSVGESLEFMDYREYQPGDNLRRLDWAASARSDKLIVKLYRQEVCPHLDILLDGSRSMSLRGTEKARAAVGLAAALAAAADNAGYSRRAYVTGQGCRPVSQAAEPPMFWKGVELDAVEGPPSRCWPCRPLAAARHPRLHQRPALAGRPLGIAAGHRRPGVGRLRAPGAGRGRRRPVAPGQFPARRQRDGRVRGAVSRRHGAGPLSPRPRAALRQLAPRPARSAACSCRWWLNGWWPTGTCHPCWKPRF